MSKIRDKTWEMKYLSISRDKALKQDKVLEMIRNEYKVLNKWLFWLNMIRVQAQYLNN